MTGISSIPQSFREGLTTLFNDKYKLVSEWRGHLIKVWDNLLQDMKNRPTVALTVFTVANLVFFTCMNHLAWSLERRINDAPQNLSPADRKLNYFLIDGFIVGGSVITFNFMLSNITQYPISKTTLAAITIGSIALRYFLHLPLEEENEVDTQHLSTEKKHQIPEDQDPLVDIDNFAEDEDKENKSKIQIENQKKAQQAQAAEALKKQEQLTFINEFCKELSLVLKNTFHYVNFSDQQKTAQVNFLEQLRTGAASIENEADMCRAVNVPIQAAFEKLLSTMLIKGDLKEAKALFLTGLPCTPLRTPLQVIDSDNAVDKIEWKKWTVDIRTNTVRELRVDGASIIASYTEKDYQALPSQSVKGKGEFDTYELEKKKDNLIDCPLDAPIPKELIGAVYTFTDADNHRYILATQGIQIQHHGETPKECWKMWLGAEESSEAQVRLGEVLKFISEHTKTNIFDVMNLEK